MLLFNISYVAIYISVLVVRVLVVCVSTSVMTNIAVRDHFITKIADDANQKMFDVIRQRPVVRHHVVAGQAMTFGELIKQLRIAKTTVSRMRQFEGPHTV